MSNEAKSRNRTVLVTGAAHRIGEQIIRAFHARGFRVLLHYHSSESKAAAVVDELDRLRPGSAMALQADLVDSSGAESLASQVREQSEGLDVLVNNASRFYPAEVGDITAETWQDIMGSNLRGPFFLTQALLPELRAAGGSVVNILDIHAERPMRRHPVYSIAKAGLSMMTRSLALELGPDIRVNGVAPGAILWPEAEPSAEAKESILAKVALQRVGNPADIASAVVYLALDAPYVTGQVLAVDGGRSLNV